jgi:hypothetical protein
MNAMAMPRMATKRTAESVNVFIDKPNFPGD